MVPFPFRSWNSFACFLMFLSGAASLVLETLFFRLLSYAFGNTAVAASTVLAVFMGGLAIGSATFGRWSSGRRNSLVAYGVLELLIGLYGLAIPFLMTLSTNLYVSSALRLGYQSGLLPLQVFFAAMALLTPAVLMGGTLPVMANFLGGIDAESEVGISKVYAANTLGAAVGTISAAYLLIPTLGIRGALWIACGIDLLLFSAILIFARSVPTVAKAEGYATENSSLISSIPRFLYLVLSFLSGAVVLGYEVVWNHALSFLVGNTVYSFALMLFCILIGLAWGSRIVSKELTSPAATPWGLVISQFLTGFVVLISLSLWQFTPSLFNLGFKGIHVVCFVLVLAILVCRLLWRLRHRPASTASWFQRNEDAIIALGIVGLSLAVTKAYGTPELSFIAGDLLRFFCAFTLLIIPCVLLGISFPLILDMASRSKAKAAEIGLVYGLNTCGAVAGSLAAGFWLLPRLGSFGSLRALALVSMFTTVVLIFWLPIQYKYKLYGCVFAISSAVVLALVIPAWSPHRINSGTYAYFAKQDWATGKILFTQEDIQSGMTTVVQSGETRLLLTNGKYQGDNREGREDQARFALVPMLFARQTNRALIIGLGTGHTLRTVSHFPFKHIDVVEISPGIVQASRVWFKDVNGGILDSDPRVSLYLADARNFLLLSKHKYDLVTIEVSSLWISGQGDLYNKEFYELVRSRLSPVGVLQQWVALHHLRQQELFLVLNTAAVSFPHTAFFQGSGHGLLIAGMAPLTSDFETVQRFNKIPQLQEELAMLGIPSLWPILKEMKLDHRGVSRVLDDISAEYSIDRNRISSDYFPRLEFGAPKGLLLPEDMFLKNSRKLNKFKLGTPSQLIVNAPSGETAEQLLDKPNNRSDENEKSVSGGTP